MIAKFDSSYIKNYSEIFGIEKMRSLFAEFEASAQEGFSQIDSADEIGLRMIFHKLKSSSLVFGMKGFSDACADIEEKILGNHTKAMLEKEIKNAKMVFNENFNEAKRFLFE